MKVAAAGALLAIATLLAGVAAAQPDLTSYLETHRQPLDLSADGARLDARLLDWRDRQIILLGESHGITINEDLDLAFLRYLHREAGVRVYLAEWGYAAALLVNQYLESGNESQLDFMMREAKGSVSWTKERRAFWVRLRQWNATLPKDQRVRLVGVDVEHQRRLALVSLGALARASSAQPPDAIAATLAKLPRSPESSYDAGIVPELTASLKDHRSVYEAFLGDRFFDFEIIGRNLQRAVDYYAARDTPKAYALREEAMIDNFRRLYARLGGGRWYGRWGSFHVLQRRAESRDRFAEFLNRPDSPVAGKVLSILTTYRAGEALMMTPGYQTRALQPDAIPLNAFSAAAAGPVTLFRLDAAGSPFRQKIPAYFGGEAPPADIVQYVVLVDKAAPQHTLETQELPPVVVRTIPEAGARDVPPDLAEIRVTFSKEMRNGTWSWCSAEAHTPPPLSNVHYDADKRTIVGAAKLAPGQKYAIWLNKGQDCVSFRDAQGNSAVPYLLSFETAPAK